MTIDTIIEKLQPYIDARTQPYHKPTIVLEYCKGRYNTNLLWTAAVSDSRGCMVQAETMEDVLNKFNDKLIEMGYYER